MKLEKIIFEMTDNGDIREYKYKGVLLFKTSRHRAFTRRTREEFIDRVAALQSRLAELEPLAEAVEWMEHYAAELITMKYPDGSKFRYKVWLQTDRHDLKGEGNSIPTALADYKAKNPEHPESQGQR